VACVVEAVVTHCGCIQPFVRPAAYAGCGVVVKAVTTNPSLGMVIAGDVALLRRQRVVGPSVFMACYCHVYE
jgi:hypothetical protein